MRDPEHRRHDEDGPGPDDVVQGLLTEAAEGVGRESSTQPSPDRPSPLLEPESSWTDRSVRLLVRRGPYGLLYVAMFLLVVVPLLMLFVNTFQLGTIGQYDGWGLENWRRGLGSSRLAQALWNTTTLSFVRQAIAMLLGIAIAYLIARTDLPGSNWLEFGFWVAYFIPGLTVTLAWIFLANDFSGILNTALTALPFIDEPPFDVFSWWGIVWVNLLASALPVKIMFLTPAFRNLDSSMEEAGRTSGDTALGTFRRITLPLLMPTFLVVFVLGVVRSFESFEVELILGVPANVEVLTSLIYRQVRAMTPPQYGLATVTSIVSLSFLIPLVVYQQWFGKRRSFATVSGKYKGEVRRLGRWRWPAFAFVFTAFALMTILPVLALVAGSFMRFFGIFQIDEPWTLDNWSSALDSRAFTSALTNTLIISFATTALVLIVFGTIAYLVVRTRLRGREALDFYSWLPTIVPGVVLGLGYLWLFLTVPFLRTIYGTVWILVIVTALGVVTLAVQLLKQGLRQLGSEMEEASWASGAGRVTTIRRIVVPLISPTLVVVAVTSFASAARTTSHIALLSTGNNQPLSILQLMQMADGNYEAASVVGILILLLTVGVALVMRAFGYKKL